MHHKSHNPHTRNTLLPLQKNKILCQKLAPVVPSFSEDLSQPEPDDIYPPTHNMRPPPYIIVQMEEFKNIIFDRVHDLVAKRLITSDLVTYADKWDTLRIYVDTTL